MKRIKRRVVSMTDHYYHYQRYYTRFKRLNALRRGFCYDFLKWPDGLRP